MPVEEIITRNATLSIGACFNGDGIYREASTSHQALRHTSRNHILEGNAKRITFTEAPMPVHREGRMAQDFTFQAQVT